MEICNVGDDKTECDSITSIELQKSKRIIYFSDGILEELSQSEIEDDAPDITDGSTQNNLEVTSLPLGPRIKYQAYHIGSRLLNGFEYVGEGLASFFGITGPKYVNKPDIANAKKGETRMYDLDNLSQSNDG